MALTDLSRWKVAGLALATSSAAIFLVKLISDHFSSDDNNNNTKSTEFRIVIPGDKVGAVIGRKGRTLRRIEFETQTILELETSKPKVRSSSEASTDEWDLEDIGEEPKSLPNGVLRIHGERLNVEKAKLAVEAILIEAAVKRIREIITIPRETIGWVIGKGGESVQRMKIQCGVHINVGREGTGDTEEVSICGPPDGIALAKKLISCKVAKFYNRSSDFRPYRRSFGEDAEGELEEFLRVREELQQEEPEW
uniref:K Homology domain-containing protein n=1 Tax=Plectus sambesii TaxID=2011161 RepID=A0A914XBN6_9BILA